MKIGFYDDFRPCIVKENGVVDLTDEVGAMDEGSPQLLMESIIGNFDSLRPRFADLQERGTVIQMEQVRLRAPLPRPGKVLCGNTNYMEGVRITPPRPLISFFKSPDAIIGPGETIVLPAEEANVFEHEAEIALVIGKTGKNIKEADALQYIFAYTNFIDGSARGPGSPGMDNFFPGKSWHTFGPMGPAVVTADEIANPQDLNVRLWSNGVLRQDYPTSDMAHKIPRIIEWVSSVMTLEPGDVIACGTNHQGLGPLQDGDELEMEIDGLGRLSGIKVKDDKKRSWPRETRSQRAKREAAAGTTAST